MRARVPMVSCMVAEGGGLERGWKYGSEMKARKTGGSTGLSIFEMLVKYFTVNVAEDMDMARFEGVPRMRTRRWILYDFILPFLVPS